VQPLRSEPAALRAVRHAILALVALGAAGMSTELVLTGHYEDANQLIPLVIAGAVLALAAWSAARPGVVVLRALQLALLLFAAAGIVGIVLHFQASAEFQRDIDPGIGRMALVSKVLEATSPPALAPGVMVQLGLLGLVYTYRHPALGGSEPDDAEGVRR
jgi:hypothetical protein